MAANPANVCHKLRAPTINSRTKLAGLAWPGLVWAGLGRPGLAWLGWGSAVGMKWDLGWVGISSQAEG